jgi:hypothetical protein
MKSIITISAMLLLISGNVLAGSEYDKCIQEENALKAEEASNCNGFSYVFNPSGCFATQKTLKQYTSTDQCKKIGIAENVDLTISLVVPAKQVSTGSPVVVNKSGAEILAQESTCEQLKAENVLLKIEIKHLKAEIEQLSNTEK